MECSSCGAPLESPLEQCGRCVSGTSFESAAISVRNNESPTNVVHSSKLIEFPGITRSTVPQWRKELSERVREVQEKRAREEALEFALDNAQPSETTPQLELLPQAETTRVNPLVAAALRRIERAHETEVYRAGNLNATAVAYAEPMLHDESETVLADDVAIEVATTSSDEPERQVEKPHNLVVGPPPAVIVVPAPEAVETSVAPKPRRMIGDVNDPALNYLDAVRTAVQVETSGHKPASVVARFVSAIVDLMVVGLLCFPFAAALELINSNWQQPRVWILAAMIFSIVGFLYFTIATALTGRTLGLRLLSLRIVDARTGLIPTGTQSAGRSLIYLASLLIFGITSVLVLLNSDRLTAHDRITRTAVIHV